MHDPSDSRDVFRRIVEEANEFSIFLLDASGRIVLWNSGAEKIFGYSAEEVIGKPFDILFTTPDLENGMPARELEVARTLGRCDDTRWHVAKDGKWVFVDGVTMPFTSDGETGFSKISRDITDRQLTERRIAAQLALTNLLNQDQPYDVVAAAVMQTICENLGWEVGALWEVRGDEIVCVRHWHAPHIDARAAVALCEDGGRVQRGVGLLGQVWETRQAVWVSDFRDRRRFPRAQAAADAGMRAAFAFPIVAAGRFLGGMEFFSGQAREPDQTLLPVMTLIGGQIGDFIERRHTHDALRESEQRFRLMTETAQDAIFTIDMNSVITFCNRAVERMFGYRPEELVGRPLDVIIPPRLREAHHRGIARFLRTRTRTIPWTGVDLPALHRDGHEFPCEISFGEWTDGQTIFTGFARDVSERKRALEQEQEARAEAERAREQLQRRAEEEAAFRHLASALSGAVEMTDVLYEITNRATHVTRADGVYVERIISSPGGQRHVEVVAAAGKGTPTRGLRVVFPGSMTDEIISGNTPVILADMSSFGRNMAPYLNDTCPDCEVLVTPLIAEREPLGALVLLNSTASGRHFRDGDIVRARTLGDLTSLALRRVRLLEQEREAKEKAEAAVRVRDETLGIVSHDLRNPLTKIVLSADLLADAPTGEQGELVETIRSSARQMERLIQDLLDVARMESGKLSVERETIEAGPLVREMCDSNRPIAAQKQQRIVCHVGDDLPPICGDHDRLVQVFGNLIGNAIKFSPQRGSITVSAIHAGDVVRFSVRDNGPGIPETDLKHVFRAYWQAKKTAHMGAGLGLAIVRGIIEAHGGTVWAENMPEGGACFSFTVPVMDAERPGLRIED